MLRVYNGVTRTNFLQLWYTGGKFAIQPNAGGLTIASLGFSWGLDSSGGPTQNLYNAENTRSLMLSTSNGKDIFLAPTGNTIFSFGNVGIGTTTPAEKLEIANGNLLLRDTVNSERSVLLRRNSADIGKLRTLGSRLTLKGLVNADVSIEDDSGNGLVLKDGGNVGIGTTSPAYSLDVNGTIQVNNTLRFTGLSAQNAPGSIYGDIADNLIIAAQQGAGKATYLGPMNGTAVKTTAGRIVFQTGNGAPVERMRIQDVNGNVGIGTTRLEC